MANGTATHPGGVIREIIPEPAARRVADRRPLREILSSASVRAREWLAPRVARVAEYRLALPGIAGAGLISAGIALRFGVWAGLIAGGLFCLRIDSRIR